MSVLESKNHQTNKHVTHHEQSLLYSSQSLFVYIHFWIQFVDVCLEDVCFSRCKWGWKSSSARSWIAGGRASRSKELVVMRRHSSHSIWEHYVGDLSPIVKIRVQNSSKTEGNVIQRHGPRKVFGAFHISKRWCFKRKEHEMWPKPCKHQCFWKAACPLDSSFPTWLTIEAKKFQTLHFLFSPGVAVPVSTSNNNDNGNNYHYKYNNNERNDYNDYNHYNG